MTYEDRQAKHKAELKREKKIKRILKKSAWAMGLGIGLLLLKIVVVPFIGTDEMAEQALQVFALCLIAYGLCIVLSFIFLRKFLFKINAVLSWVLLPLVFLKLLLDAVA